MTLTVQVHIGSKAEYVGLCRILRKTCKKKPTPQLGNYPSSLPVRDELASWSLVLKSRLPVSAIVLCSTWSRTIGYFALRVHGQFSTFQGICCNERD